jgi:hypothetical protein
VTLNEQLCCLWGTCFGATIRGFVMKQIIARIVAWFSGDVMKKIIKCIPQIVAEVEAAMADGTITADERKKIALDTINILATQFGVNLSSIMKWVISVIIDNVAKSLPSKDIKVPDAVKAVVKELNGKA